MFSPRFLIRSFRISALVIVSVAALTNATLAQPFTWHYMGKAGATCGYFWNARTGVTGYGTSILYTRDGRTWRDGSGLTGNLFVSSIRCFDGRTLYAAGLNRGVGNGEVWKSTDSGVSWSFVFSQPLGINPNGWEGADVYWDYKANAPALRGTTVVSLDSNHLFNTQGDWAAYRSMDGGISWKSCGSSIAGFSAYADPLNKLYYSSQEIGYILSSTDSGMTWNSLPKMPSVAWMDGVEGCGEKIFVRTGVGLYRSINRGTTWDSLGGPKTRFQEARRFNIIGCSCSTVIAPDDTGALWIANPEDATPPPSLHSTFSTNGFECDTSNILVKIDSSFLPGRLRLYLTDDSDGTFSIIGPDTILGNSTGSNIFVSFTSHDLRSHHATITIVPLDYGQCMSESHTISGRASLAAPVIPGAYVRVGCDTAKGAITILNSNCDSIRLTSANNPSSDFSLLPFDSVVKATGSIPFSFLPLLKTGLQKYSVHLTGHFEPSGIPFDTIISVTAQYGHLYSNVVVPALTFDLGILPNCNPQRRYAVHILE
ncbi:MAG: hypothetical protein Q8922_15265 [Bacteroidota bacterium]|nr:hypothetical protein [Bacteroidota bacterium]MDP4234061.1 hypothetical protein [Bacteroidota bacterium]MDP4242927.1 hypothetical protein [Bacteroidota bacterium]MDP4289276.1 hypothetical protein [Bacteroidota bacterium]